MKRTLAILAAAALALVLAACGAERGDMPDTGRIAGGTTATDTMRSNDGQTGAGTTGGATANKNTLDNGLGSVTGAVDRATDGMSGRAAGGAYGVGGPNSSVYAATNNGGVTAETRYKLMLENARVHDTDGFLLDGENASYGTF